MNIIREGEKARLSNVVLDDQWWSPKLSSCCRWGQAVFVCPDEGQGRPSPIYQFVIKHLWTLINYTQLNYIFWQSARSMWGEFQGIPLVVGPFFCKALFFLFSHFFPSKLLLKHKCLTMNIQLIYCSRKEGGNHQKFQRKKKLCS